MDDRNLSAVDVSRDHRMNDLLDDQKMDVMTDASRDLRMSGLHLDVTGDRNLSAVDVNRGHHMSDLLDDQNLDGNLDASRGLRKNGLHLVVKILDVNRYCHRVIRKCALRVKNYHCHRVDLSLGAKKTGDLNMNCDQLSRDHLLCDHRKLRHHGKNLSLDAKNLDASWC
jgi:hypothetical protein